MYIGQIKLQNILIRLHSSFNLERITQINVVIFLSYSVLLKSGISVLLTTAVFTNELNILPINSFFFLIYEH